MTHSSDDLDRMISEALDAEDREIFGELGEEPGYFSQALALFRGKLAWVMWVIYITNIVAAGIAIWAAWKMFQTTDPVMTMRWGVLIMVSIFIGLFMKSTLGYQLLSNRVLREIKRLELQLARGQSRGSA